MTRIPLALPRLAVMLLCLSLGTSSALFAQRSDRATISGVVLDAQGNAVPGATVTAQAGLYSWGAEPSDHLSGRKLFPCPSLSYCGVAWTKRMP